MSGFQEPTLNMIESIQNIVGNSFTRDQIVTALQLTSLNQTAAIDMLQTNPPLPQQQDPAIPQSQDVIPSSQNQEEYELAEALKLSILNLVDEAESQELKDRVEGELVGLKNVGNTCYFNSMMQFYFSIPKIVQQICNTPDKLPEAKDQKKQKCINLVAQCRKLFIQMVISKKNYVIPSSVLNTIVDDQGQNIQIGDQEDACEFSIQFQARLDEGLQEFTQKEASQVQTEIGKKMLTKSLKASQNLAAYSSQAHEQRGIIQNLFFGILIQNIYSKEKDGSEVSLEQEIDFGYIMVDISNKDLYTAWDSFMFNKIETFQTPQNFLTQANQEFWVKTLPPILSFQIKRVVYDKENSIQVKLEEQLHFPEVLYADRFLLKNKEKALPMRLKMIELQEKKKQLELSLNQFEKFEGSQSALGEFLNLASIFLEMQSSGENENATQIQTQLPDQKIKDTALILREYESTVVNMVQQLNQQINDLKKEYQQTFENPDLNQEKYLLHSILIHKGKAGSGHYYTYIKDFQTNKWRQFSDAIVTESSPEVVFEEAFGGKGEISAYCLFYVKPNFIEQQKSLLELYKEIIPQHLLSPFKEEIKKEEVKQIQLSVEDQLKQISDLYVERFNVAQSKSSESQDQKS